MINTPSQVGEAFARFDELSKSNSLVAKSKAYLDDVRVLMNYIQVLSREIERLEKYEQDSIKCDRIIAAFNRFCAETGVSGPVTA